MTARFFLTVAIFLFAISNCYAVHGIIWRKQKQEFVQLFSIPQFAALQKENIAKHRAMEMQDMSGVVVKAVYYEVKNIVMFYDNDTKVMGACGELWPVLAEYLNFTFIPVKIEEQIFGTMLKNGTYTGLVGMLAQGKADVIMRSGYFKDRTSLVDYTTPLWKSAFHIYVRPEWLFDNSWVFTLLSPEMWFFVVCSFVILSFFGYFLQKIPMDKKHKRKNSVDFSLGDHFFYSFAMMTARGYIPDSFYNKFKILSLSKSIFAWLILLAFSSHLIYRMTNKQMTLPFTDLQTLFNNTKYILLAFRGSFSFEALNSKNIDSNGKNSFARIHFIDNAEDMQSKICNNLKKYAMYEIEDRYMALARSGCPLYAMGSYNNTWITFAVRKDFRYKKTINSAIIKLRETGLLNGLKEYWLGSKRTNKEPINFKMIDFHQVYLIFLILCYGILISLVILVLENITYYNTK
ncbi:glutamate receptor 1-like [Pogonomyrmex barbatus]|uniref:Glutamate receptor 1-like n=1 Tax=Pogonomyrmex barbatus TaxID=144034 RepID=A0A8N1S646_9HYME|nr:glutamate receptor 1-like [Pogonomyrmex barbatus]